MHFSPNQTPLGESPNEQKPELIFKELFLQMDQNYRQNISKIQTNNDKKVLILNTEHLIKEKTQEKPFSSKKAEDLKKLLKTIPHLCDQNFTFFNSEDDFLITPLSVYNKRVLYKIEQLDDDPLYTSENFDQCIKIADKIANSYHLYDAFIILHETDTMAYTASYLSFMFENLGKTVILTGSQVSLGEMVNDAFENLLGALTIAGHFTVPEVTIYFSNKLLRGNRATKVDSFDREGFDAPKSKPLASFGTSLQIEWENIARLNQNSFIAHKQLSKKIGVISLYPSIPIKLIKNILDGDVEACIIETYGTGNLPFGKPMMMELFKKASAEGKILLVTTRCLRGSVYEFNAMPENYKEMGFIPGRDMTFECALAKLSFLLGQKLSKERIKDLLQKDLRGEVTVDTIVKFEAKESLILDNLIQSLRQKTGQNNLTEGLLPTLTSHAARFGFVNVLCDLQQHGISFESGDHHGKTPLHIAAEQGQIVTTEFIISQKVSLNILDKQGRSALFIAILRGSYQIALKLIQAGAKVIAHQKDLNRLLFKFAEKGDLEGLKLLFDGGIQNMDQYVNLDKRTIGHIAYAENRAEIIDFLKDEVKFDFTKTDRWNKTPLSDAREQSKSFLVDNSLINGSPLEKVPISKEAKKTFDFQDQNDQPTQEVFPEELNSIQIKFN